MKQRSDCLVHLNTVCRSAGMKLTQQRLEVYSELAHATDHPSPETLHQRLLPRMPSLSLDTVYRTLAVLARHNLVQRIDTFHNQARYEIAQTSHHHLMCCQCHTISDFSWEAFNRMMLPEETASWGSVGKKSVVLTGICNKCRSDSAGVQSAGCVCKPGRRSKTVNGFVGIKKEE